MTSDGTGRALEERIAALFQRAGCEAGIRVDAQGVRGSENIDVYVKFEPLGLADAWVVECKNHAKPIERAHVQVLQMKAANVGASRGVLVSTSGFQKGCHETARQSNTLLLTEHDLEQALSNETWFRRIHGLLARATRLADELFQLMTPTQGGPSFGGAKLPAGPGSEDFIANFGRLGQIRDSLTRVLAGEGAYDLPFGSDAPIVRVSTAEEYFDRIETFLNHIEEWRQRLSPRV